LKRRLAKYRTENNSTIAEPSLSDFFTQNKVDVYNEKASTNEAKVLAGLKIYIERVR
jgi:hypothetical protein